ncbi:MAG: host-nuclease inhibitor Gam family protein [Prevotellaceae bacterium]|jgi:hypothetical protein|nr:host-nuclease inhibitor Gam family protein [Prevotellaceae bacterium]
MKKVSKESPKTGKKSLTIEEITQLYRTYADAEKTAKESAEPYRKLILDYAREHPDKFDGRTLKLPNGVRVEIRVTEKSEFDEGKVSLEWLSDAIDAGLGDAVSVKIDGKALGTKLDKSQNALLKKIGYATVEKETYAVCINS